VEFNRRWEIGAQLGAGGFGRVFVATGEDGTAAVAKFVPKAPGAERELLFIRLDNVRNVVPVIDHGETSDAWVLVMPRADRSLRDELAGSGGRLPLGHALAVLRDVATALADIDGRIVHRDLKPENVLLLRGTWCLADFGISRYAEASTAPDTRKFAMSPPYAAPERWRAERATIAADVYALGLIAVEMLTGRPPFPGTGVEDYREQHLHASPGHLDIGPPRLAALVEECLYKAPAARPSPANLLARLEGVSEQPQPSGAPLVRVHQKEVACRGNEELAASRAQTELERRKELYAAARHSLTAIARELLGVIRRDAPSVDVRPALPPAVGWTAKFKGATLSLHGPNFVARAPWDDSRCPAFDVITYASIRAVLPPKKPRGQHRGYAGRSHSLWFCDVAIAGAYGWFETAFMLSPELRRRAFDPSTEPFDHDPDTRAAPGLCGGKMADCHVAWPFTPLVIGDLGEFVDRWVEWFADAIEGRLARPSHMPERPVDGTWR
jgi:eukaryotic-like serine/threonine-protein kinase